MRHAVKLRYCLLLAALAAGAASAGIACGETPTLLQFLKERQTRRGAHVPREVLAFYYTWYGRPERHGHWVHWGGENPAKHDIPESTHYPAQGAYDSHDPATIDGHIELAQAHGLTGFIATWWGQGTYDDRAFATLLARAGQKGFKVTVYWETAPGEGAAQIDHAVADLLFVLQRYGAAEAFLKVDGKPVVFVYGRVMDQVPLASWPAIIQRVRQQYGRDFLLIADGYNEAYARLFDGVHTYNICGWVQRKSADELRQASGAAFADAVRLARSHGRISCVTVIPGYDDTKIRKPGLKAERHGGQTYRVLWEEAQKADPDWVLITSWNEWHEGSEIEPSWEDGDQYVKLTSGHAQRFRATAARRVPVPGEPAGLDPQQAKLLRELYRGKTIGVLPDYGSPAVFWLVDAGIPLEELSWQQLLDPQVLDPRRLPMLLYASGEHYVRTVHQDGDVEAALQRYLSGGGMLIACGFQPYPFFYDQTGQANIAAGRLGFPLDGSGPARQGDKQNRAFVRSWESPPRDVALTFHVDNQRLPGLPATVAFPAGGDLRWRPATAALAAAEDVYVPLASLRDAQGNCYGDGIAYIEHRLSSPRGGRNLYVWMRMPDLLGTNGTLFSLFRFAATVPAASSLSRNPAE
jgi:hypothetical protein